MSEITWDERLWTDVLYPRYKKFADLWALRVLPERMDSKEKVFLTDAIRAYSHITEIPSVSTRRQQQEEFQKLQSSYCCDRE